MFSLIIEGEGGPSEDRENSQIFFFFLMNPSLTLISSFQLKKGCLGGGGWVDQPITTPISGSSLDIL